MVVFFFFFFMELNSSEQVLEDFAKDVHVLNRLSADEFEKLVTILLKRKGWDAEQTQKTCDGGKDIIAVYDINGIACNLWVECKHYNEHTPVGVKIVREALGVKSAHNVNLFAIASASGFSINAKEFADKNNILLWGPDKLYEMAQK